MPSAEPWLNDPVVHEGEQTYHSTGMGLEPGSAGAKAVSFLPSRPVANLICGVVQLPKLGLVSALDRVEPGELVFVLRGCP